MSRSKRPYLRGRRSVPRRRRGEQGFALLEILVAFVVLALGMGAISTGVVLAMRTDGRLSSSRTALNVARSRLEAAGIADVLSPGQRKGQTTDHYRWLETVTAVRTGAEPAPSRGGTPSEPGPGNGLAAFWVEVAVRAADGTVARLGALKLAGAMP